MVVQYTVDEYTEDFGPATELSKCFYGIHNTQVKSIINSRDIGNYIKMKHISIHLYNNTAGFAGTAIYGGWVDTCKFRINHEFLSKYSIFLYYTSL